MADRTITTDLIGRDRMSKAFDSAGRSAEKNSKLIAGAGRVMGTVVKAGALAAAGGLAAVGGFLVKGVKDAASYQKLQAKTAAVLKSTGNKARTSGKEIRRLAGELESLSGIDEELIINSQNVLLTFTGVRNEVGKGNDIFTQATKAALNMSTALGTDLQGASIQVGKALNDPIKGVTALARVGVSFTAQQKEQIKTLVESGRAMDAQKLILKELSTEFGGAAKAAGSGFEGSLARAQDALGDLGREVGTQLLPAVTKAADWFATEGVPKIKGFADRIRNDVIPAIREAWSGISRQLPDVDLSGLGANIKKQAKKWGGPFVDGIKEGIKTGDWSSLGQTVVDGLFSGAELTGKAIGDVAAAFGDWAQSVDWFSIGMDVGSKAGPFAVGFVAKLGEGLFTAFKEHPKDFTIGILSFFGVGKLGGVISKVLGKIPILRVFAPFFAKWNDLTGPVNGAVGKFVGRIFTAFTREFARIFPRTEGLVTKRLRGVAETIALKALFARDAAVKFVNGIPEGIGKGLSRVSGAATRIIIRLTSPFVSAASWLIDKGRHVIGGLIRGIRDRMPGLRPSAGSAKRVIINALSGSGSWLLGAGARVIQGLIDGVRSKFGALGGVMGEAAGKVRDFWPFSPAKTGPLKSHPMDKAGANIVDMLGRGVASKVGGLQATTGRAAAAVTGTAATVPRSGRVASGGSLVVNVYVTQPLANANQLRRAMVDAFEQATPGGPKLPAAAVAAR